MSSDDAFNSGRIYAATFIFEVDGVEIGHFQEVSGLEVSIETEPLAEGGQNGFVHHLPGRMTWPNIVLKRGVTQNDSLLTWLTKSSGEQFANNNNTLTKSTAAITLTGPGGKRLRAWNFDGVYPVKWTGPQFAVDATDIASEQLEISHQGFKAEDL